MVTLAQNVLARALSASTRSGYKSAVNHIMRFHEKRSIDFAFPVSPDTLCLWMADSLDKLRYQSIRTYLHGIATTQMEMGYPSPLPQSPLIWRMFKAIKRIQGQQVVRKRLPITVRILSQIDSLFDTHKESDLCMCAAMWLGTCGLLRAGEFTSKPTTQHSLKIQHLTFHDRHRHEVDPFLAGAEAPHYMSLRLDQSKTDPFRRGTDVIIGNPTAIQHMIAYLRFRTSRLKRMPLFAGADGQPLTTAALVKFTQTLIERAHIPNAHLFLGHSFRKGGATSLHEAGHPDSLIRMMGRWASFAFATYVDTPLHMLVAAGLSLRELEHTPTSVSAFWDVNNLL